MEEYVYFRHETKQSFNSTGKCLKAATGAQSRARDVQVLSHGKVRSKVQCWTKRRGCQGCLAYDQVTIPLERDLLALTDMPKARPGAVGDPETQTYENSTPCCGTARQRKAGINATWWELTGRKIALEAALNALHRRGSEIITRCWEMHWSYLSISPTGWGQSESFLVTHWSEELP